MHAPFPRCGHSPVICDYLFNSVLDGDEYDDDQPKYSWNKGNYCLLSDALSRVDWEMEFSHLSVDSAYKLFLTILDNLVDLYVPRCVWGHGVPWTVKPPAALKVTRANAWRQYKELRSLFWQTLCNCKWSTC